MVEKFSIYFKKMLVGLVVFLAGACGYAEWPPKLMSLNDINTPLEEKNSFKRGQSVIIGKGQSLYSLSRSYKVPIKLIIELNDLTPPFILKVGQQLILPVQGRVHKVIAGDTLYGIARRYGVDPYKIARLNGVRPPYLIYIGEKITLLGKSEFELKPSSYKGEMIQQVEKKEKNNRSNVNVKPLRRLGHSKLKKSAKERSFKSKSLLVPPPKSGLGFIWPVKGKIISRFGIKPKGLRNDGVNIKAGRGTPVLVAENGVVAYAGNELRGFGELLLVKHAGGWITAYAHNEKLLVKTGQQLRRGQKIATVGSTGNVTSPQLHFEIRRGKTAKDPRKYIKNKA